MSAPPWCKLCGVRHEASGACHDSIEATEPERYGWRVRALSDTGTETFGVLIARSGERWRARVVTLPNMLWCVPGGRCTMKFVGDSTSEVENQAKRFIIGVCRRRKLTMTEDAVQEQPRAVKAEGTDMDFGPRTRITQVLRVRFGTGRTRREAQTNDLSGHGLFIATEQRLPVGQEIKMSLDIDSYTVPLVGTVRWVREQPDGGRPPGMGVELHRPPAMYQQYAEKLRRQCQAEQAEQAEKAEKAEQEPAIAD